MKIFLYFILISLIHNGLYADKDMETILSHVDRILGTQELIVAFVAVLLAVMSLVGGYVLFIGRRELIRLTKAYKKLEVHVREIENTKSLFEMGMQNLKDTMFFLTEGDKSMDSNKFDEAIRWYQYAIGNDKYHAAYIKISNAYIKMGEYENAKKYLLEAEKLYPENLLILNSVARVYRKLRDFRTSEKYYKKALKINDTFVWSLAGLAEIYLIEEKYEKSKSMLNKLADTDSILKYRKRVDIALTYFHTNAGKQAERKLHQALDHINSALESHYYKNNDLLYSYKIIALAALKEYEQADETLKKFAENIGILPPTYETIFNRLEALKKIDSEAYDGIDNLIAKLTALAKIEV